MTENKITVVPTSAKEIDLTNAILISRCLSLLDLSRKLKVNTPAMMALAVKNTKLMGTTSVASNTFIASLRNLWR